MSQEPKSLFGMKVVVADIPQNKVLFVSPVRTTHYENLTTGEQAKIDNLIDQVKKARSAVITTHQPSNKAATPKETGDES